MYDKVLASAILKVLERAFPSRLQFAELKGQLPNFAGTPDPEWINAIYALHQLGEVNANFINTDQQYDPIDVIDVAETAAQHVLFSGGVKESRGASQLDPLLQILDRRAFDADLSSFTAKASATRPLTLLMIDLDHFKRVNDTYGHLVGDGVLRQTAGLIRAASAGKGSCYRYGGEELAVLLSNHGVEEASAVAERLRRSIHEENFTPCSERMTVSIGISTYPETTKDGARLLENTDAALYEAKRSGRNRVSVAPGFTPSNVPVGDKTSRMEAVRLAVELQQGVPGNYILTVKNPSDSEVSVEEIRFEADGLRLGGRQRKLGDKWDVPPGGSQIILSPHPDPAYALLTLHKWPRETFNATVEVVLHCKILENAKEFRQKILVQVEPLNQRLEQLLR